MEKSISIKSRQQKYIDDMDATGYEPTIVADKPFLRGIRDLGYKDPGFALDELIDNSIEGAAENVAVVFGHTDRSDKKPTHIAIADDGVGMPAKLLRAAVVWGGTDRENSRELFGRYGFGLPSACVSIGERYEVYSKQDGVWHHVPMYLDEIFANDSKYMDERGRVVPPTAKVKSPPNWLMQEVGRTFDLNATESATVVVISNLDRDGFKTTSKWQDFLLEHVGTVYRNYIGRVRITVHGTVVEPVDPLFLNPRGRHYDENGLFAQELPALEVPVRERDDKGNRGEVIGVIKVRFAYLPAGFNYRRGDDGQLIITNAAKEMNRRFQIMKANNGILFLRAGRQIDVVSSKCPWLTFVNYDRHWKVEIDFPPTLDDYFSITTSKQQVVPSDRIWSILEEAGVDKVIEQMRKQFRTDNVIFRKDAEERTASAEGVRTSEEIMEQSTKFETAVVPVPKARQEEADSKVDQEAEQRARESGRKKEDVRKEIDADIADRGYLIRFDRAKGAPFYRPEWFGGQIQVFINEEHPFFTDVYRDPETSPRMRAALETLLFVIGESELRATGEAAMFYETARSEWSRSWSRALKLLEQRKSVADEASAAEASEERN